MAVRRRRAGLGTMNTTITPARTRLDIEELFAKWGVDEFRIPREDTRSEYGAARIIYYIGDKAQELKCDRFQRYADNLRSLWQILEAMRKADERGILKELARAATALLGEGTPQSRPWYEVLQVTPTTGNEIVKMAYKTLAKQHHPDNGGDPRTMAEINKGREEFEAERGLRDAAVTA